MTPYRAAIVRPQPAPTPRWRQALHLFAHLFATNPLLLRFVTLGGHEYSEWYCTTCGRIDERRHAVLCSGCNPELDPLKLREPTLDDYLDASFRRAFRRLP